MSLDDLVPDDTTLTVEEVSQEISALTDTIPIEANNGPRFYAEKYDTSEGKKGTLFAAVLPGPRLYIDPTAKETVFGQTPPFVRNNPNFEETKSYEGSFRYSIMLDDFEELPDEAKRAIEWSYECVKS